MWEIMLIVETDLSTFCGSIGSLNELATFCSMGVLSATGEDTSGAGSVEGTLVVVLRVKNPPFGAG
jgi:hypothetical protein